MAKTQQDETKSDQTPGAQPAGLRVFISYGHEDAGDAKALFEFLKNDDHELWMDKESLLGGQDWASEIRKAVRRADVFLALVSEKSLGRRGYLHKEVGIALDAAEERPEAEMFIIPIRLDHADIPDRLSKFHCIDYFEEDGGERLRVALRRASLSIAPVSGQADDEEPRNERFHSNQAEARAAEPKTKSRAPWVSIWLIAILTLFASVYALYKYAGVNTQPENVHQERTMALFEDWVGRKPDLVGRQGVPETTKFVDLWMQNFDRGKIIYNVTDDWLVVVKSESNSYLRFPKPLALVTYGPGNRQINERLVTELLADYEPATANRMRTLLGDRQLMGGIATVYLQEQLHRSLGDPVQSEFSQPDVVYAANDGYEFLAGLISDKGAKFETQIWSFERNGTRAAKSSSFLYRGNPRPERR